MSHLAQVAHFLILDVLVDVTGVAGGGTSLPHDQDPLLPRLRVNPLKPDAGRGLYPLHRLHDDDHLCLLNIFFNASNITHKIYLAVSNVRIHKKRCILEVILAI